MLNKIKSTLIRLSRLKFILFKVISMEIYPLFYPLFGNLFDIFWLK